MHPANLHKSINNLLQHLAIVNFCSVTNKQAELEAFLITHNIHFLLGTESHLDESVTNPEIFPRHYHVYRKDRNIHSGGVFILVDESISSSQILSNFMHQPTITLS